MKHPKNMTTEEIIELADEIKRGMSIKVMNDIEELKSAKSKVYIPANIDAIKLADRIKSNMTTEWLKRYNKYFRPKSH